MDRSFLSDRSVIAASRKFVCARLATYESKSEGKLLESIFTGRSGLLENTVFTILAPDGKTQLARAGRGPHFAFRDPAGMAQDMERIAKKHPGSKQAQGAAPLPLCADVRRGLNIASCDSLPLIVVSGANEKQRKALETKLAALAWKDNLIGRAIYASTSDATKELKPIAGVKKDAAFLVVQPGTYGQDGTVLAQASGTATDKELAAVLARGIAAHKAPAKANIRRHVSQGKRDGINWETEIPVTDPGKPPPGGGPGGREGPPPGGPGGHRGPPPERR